MNFDQWAIIGLLLVMLVTYASERFRVELVAMTGLAIAFIIGLVPIQNVFAGFSSPAVITVTEVLLIVSALSGTRAVDSFARRIIARTRNETAILAVLCCTGAFVSVFMNNIGALALMFPVALSVCARLEIPPGRVLMALSFATLLGGTCSLTGTPANLIVNEWKIQETGGSFAYFELGLLGAPVALAGLAWIIFASPRFFRDMKVPEAPGFEAGPAAFLAELSVPPSSALIGLHLGEVEDRHDLRVHNVIRHGAHVFARRGDIVVAADDILLVEASPARFDGAREEGLLADPGRNSPDAERIEVVAMPDSLLIGSRVGDIMAFMERAVRVVGLASRRHRVEGRFEDLQIGMGDVLILAGERNALREAAADCGVLPLSPRRPPLINARAGTSVAIFGAGVLLTALGLLPPELAFGAVVVAMMMVGGLNLRSALQDVNWTIVILLGCMIPLGAAVEDTGAARVIADAIADQLPFADPVGVAVLMLLVAVAITPFIDNVSTAVILSPIAASIASRTGVPVDTLLMAVAIGASLDFLTPFGHHNNTVVMGVAGYRFLDFPRFGAPLLLICVLVAIPVLAWLQSGAGLATIFNAP